MVMKMNKSGFIKELQKELNYDENRCVVINSIIEDTFLIGKNNKEKMVSRFIDELKVSESDANNIYEVAMSIISSNIKNRLKHPFKKFDK